jgi:hypothetical protein
MPPQPTPRDYKLGSADPKSASRAGSRAPLSAGGAVDPPNPQEAAYAAIEEFLTLLARAVRQFHTYPATSPLCGDAVAACHRVLTSLERSDRLAFVVTPRELILDDRGFGGGTIVEHELVRRLHKGRVAGLDIDRAASPRDLSRFCTDVNRCDEHSDPTFAELLVEHGVEMIVARMARRPEVLDLGLPPEPLRTFVGRDQQRRTAAPSSGPVDYLYPPEKGWIRFDPSAALDTVSLLDLAVLVNDPADMASMLLRLTDDGAAGAVSTEQALEQKFADVAMLFSALDGHLARVMFGKLARAVLAIEPERRAALLRRTILPGLLDGRADGAVLRDFPDPDLAESLCLLLEFETAAPEVVSAALNRLDLPADRRQTIASLVDQRLNSGPAPPTEGRDQNVDRFARRLVQVDAAAGKDFAEFAAFDLSIDDQTTDAIADVRRIVGAPDTIRAQVDCLRRLVRLEPNPRLVAAFMRRILDLFGELDRAKRWHDLAAAASPCRELLTELAAARPDAVDAIDAALGAYWTKERTLALLAKHEQDDGARAIVRLLFEAFGHSIAPGFVDVLADASLQALSRPLVAFMCDHAAQLAPGLVNYLGQRGPLADRGIVRVLGFAGVGYEVLISEQLASRDEQTVRAALRALARIGTTRAAALVASHVHHGGGIARAAEEALWHFPQAQTMFQVRDLLGRRDFVVQNPDTVVRLLERASATGAGDLGHVLEDLEAFRFRLWKPDLVRVAKKARGLRSR